MQILAFFNYNKQIRQSILYTTSPINNNGIIPRRLSATSKNYGGIQKMKQELKEESKDNSQQWLSKKVSRPGVPNGRINVERSFWELSPEEQAKTEKEMVETAYQGFGKLDTVVSIAVDAETKEKMKCSRPKGWNFSNHMRSCLRSGAKLNGTLAKMRDGNNEAVKQIDSTVLSKLKGLIEALAA